MTLYYAWPVRYVPNPVSGEFTNVAILAGSGDDWALRRIQNFNRASSLGGDASHTIPYLDSLELRAQARQCDPTLPGIEPPAGQRPLTFEELELLRAHSHGQVQFGQPMPTMGHTAAEAASFVFEAVVYDPPVPQHTQARARVRNALHQALEGNPSTRRNLRPASHARVSTFTMDLDYALDSGTGLYLTRAWAFDIKSIVNVERHILAWTYAVTVLRDEGGEAVFPAAGPTATVPRDVDIATLYSSPTTSSGEDSLATVLDSWDRAGITAYPLADADRLASDGAEALHLSAAR